MTTQQLTNIKGTGNLCAYTSALARPQTWYLIQ